MSITVSIVEDDLPTRNSLVKFVELHATELTLAHICESAHVLLSKPQLDSNNINILLLDVGLPGMSGVDAIPLILERFPDLSIIMLSTYDDESTILKALCRGASSYVSKGASIDEIYAAIKVVVSGGAYMSPFIAREIVNHFLGNKRKKGTLLNERQLQILELLVEGKSYQAIAQHFFLSIETIRTHIKKIYKIMQVNSKTEAVAKYLKGDLR